VLIIAVIGRRSQPISVLIADVLANDVDLFSAVKGIHLRLMVICVYSMEK
jgi:hypothetical protein